jgi:hypothetical protein
LERIKKHYEDLTQDSGCLYVRVLFTIIFNISIIQSPIVGRMTNYNRLGSKRLWPKFGTIPEYFCKNWGKARKISRRPFTCPELKATPFESRVNQIVMDDTELKKNVAWSDCDLMYYPNMHLEWQIKTTETLIQNGHLCDKFDLDTSWIQVRDVKVIPVTGRGGS